MTRLWEKGEPLDPKVLAYTTGDDPELDARLVPHDVRASIAHASMLRERGYLSAADLSAIAGGLEALAAEHARGEWSITPEEEDVHTALEGRLEARIGEPARRIHLGRSRNDQVLAAIRLYLLHEIERLAAAGERTLAALDRLVVRDGAIALPGYTHLQRAMPSTVELWAGGVRAEIAEDLASLRRVSVRVSRNPLGSAAGYGVPEVSIDRESTRRALGFQSTQEPVTAVQLSRGKPEAAVLFELALLLEDCARLAADVCLYATAEFGFVRLAPRITTGSSMMPQKRNPDLWELVRADAAALPAALQEVLAIRHGLPSGYHRDLQRLKGALFRGIDRAEAVLEVLPVGIDGIAFDEARCKAALDPSLTATAAANRIVAAEGIPFRDAYRRAAADPGSWEPVRDAAAP